MNDKAVESEIKQTATLITVNDNALVKRQIERTDLPIKLNKVNVDMRLTTLFAARTDSLASTKLTQFTGVHHSHIDSLTKGVEFTETPFSTKSIIQGAKNPHSTSFTPNIHSVISTTRVQLGIGKATTVLPITRSIPTIRTQSSTSGLKSKATPMLRNLNRAMITIPQELEATMVTRMQSITESVKNSLDLKKNLDASYLTSMAIPVHSFDIIFAFYFLLLSCIVSQLLANVNYILQ